MKVNSISNNIFYFFDYKSNPLQYNSNNNNNIRTVYSIQVEFKLKREIVE